MKMNMKWKKVKMKFNEMKWNETKWKWHSTKWNENEMKYKWNEGDIEWKNEWMKEWRNEGMKEWMTGWPTVRMTDWLNDWLMKQPMIQWKDEATNESINQERMVRWMNESTTSLLSSFLTGPPLRWGISSLSDFFSHPLLLCAASLSYLFCSFCNTILAFFYSRIYQPPAASHSRSVAASVTLSCKQCQCALPRCRDASPAHKSGASLGLELVI